MEADKKFKITYDLTWTYEDKAMEGQVKTVENTDAYNAVATLQYLIGDSVKVDIVRVEEI